MLSAHEDTIYPTRVLQAGAAGYLTKRGAPEELIGAIRQVAAGKTFVEATVAQQMAVQRASGQRTPIDVLTAKEFSVFLALAQGRSVNDIAATMSLSHSVSGMMFPIASFWTFGSMLVSRFESTFVSSRTTVSRW